MGLLLLCTCDGEGSLSEDGGTPIEDAAMDVVGEGHVACAPGTRTGAAGSSDDVPTTFGPTIDVRTPDDYDPTVAYPLIVVYGPAGADSALTELFTGLTAGAVARGYIISYVDHISPSTLENIELAAAIPDEIADMWCIDEKRIFTTGHSDGGTISGAALAGDEEAPVPRAAAPSAAGLTRATMTAIGCPPEARAMMVMHSTNDLLFPVGQGFGGEVALFWADCNACEEPPVSVGSCQQWGPCDAGTQVLYCEGSGTHVQWPGLNEEILDFFDAQR